MATTTAKRRVKTVISPAQASATISANSLSGGAVTDIVCAAGGNADGCDFLRFIAKVSTAPGTATSMLLYRSVSWDGGTSWSEYMPCGVFQGVTTSNSKNYVCEVRDPCGDRARFKLYAVGYQIVASLDCEPNYWIAE